MSVRDVREFLAEMAGSALAALPRPRPRLHLVPDVETLPGGWPDDGVRSGPALHLVSDMPLCALCVLGRVHRCKVRP